MSSLCRHLKRFGPTGVFACLHRNWICKNTPPTYSNGCLKRCVIQLERFRLDKVQLKHDIEENGLRASDIGAIVYVYKKHMTYEVEFVTGEGETIAILTLTSEDIRAIGEHETPHVREITPA